MTKRDDLIGVWRNPIMSMIHFAFLQPFDIYIKESFLGITKYNWLVLSQKKRKKYLTLYGNYKKYLFKHPKIFAEQPVVLKNKVEQNSFTLMIQLYQEENAKRIEEFLYCLRCNISSRLFSHIEVFFQGNKKSILYQELEKIQGISIFFADSRLSYNVALERAKSKYSATVLCVANADIVFSKSFNALKKKDLSDVVLAITRWEKKADKIKLFYQKNNSHFSQDVWILHPSKKFILEQDVFFGVHNCDGYIAYQLYRKGVDVCNPCLSFKAIHIHSCKSIESLDLGYTQVVGVPWQY